MQNEVITTLIAQGRKALAEKRWDDAQEHYRAILAVDADQPRAWLALSAIAQSQGHYREAVQAAREAAEGWRRSGTQAFLAEVCMRLLVLGEYRTARELIVGADWNDPVVLRYSMGLVQYLGLAEAHEEALKLADHAMARLVDPPAALLFARATALRYLGRADEATDAYAQCLAMDPLHGEAHWALAHHARSSTPAERVPRLRKALAHIAQDNEDRIYLHYALFKELDDADFVDEAWEALDHGARVKRRVIRHDTAAERARYDTLKAACTTEFINAPGASTARAAHRPVFIVGLPRSGTTVVERMLGSHPQVASAGELNDFSAQMSWETNRFLSEPLSDADLSAMHDIDFDSLGRGYLERTAWRAEGAQVLVDKLPNNLLHAGFIHRALPEARIICVRRDPMDSCFSAFKHLFSGQTYPWSYDLTETTAQYRQFEALIQHWSRVLPDRWLLADYEDVVRDPQGWAKHIAEFCGLEYDDAMTRIEDNRAPAATASTSQVREAVHDRNIGSWQRYARFLGRLGM